MSERCYAQGPDCDGPVEAHHLVKRQRIRRVWEALKKDQRRGGPEPWSITKAIADPRNIVYACKRTHHIEESPVPIPDGFGDFVAEYNFAGLVPRWMACGAAAPPFPTSPGQGTVVIADAQPSREVRAMTGHDPEDFLAQEQADRALERGDSPLTHLSVEPLDVCRECGYMAREVEPGRWICPCEPWSAAA